MIEGDHVSDGAIFWDEEEHKSSSRRKKIGLFSLFLFFASGAVVAVSAFLMSEYDVEDLGAEDPFDTTSPTTTATQIFTNAPTGDTSSPTSLPTNPPSTVPTKTSSLNPTILPTVSPANLHTSSPVVEVNLSDADAHCPGNSDGAVANKYFSLS